MKREQFNSCKKLTDFQKACLTNEYHGGKRFLQLWEQAKTFEEFLQLVREDKTLSKTQGTGQLFKNDWYFCREQLGDKSKKTYSDVGGLKVGNDNFSVIIPNGYGDGTTRYAIFDSTDELNIDCFKFFTSIKGENINIYSYDLGEEIAETISGQFLVYSGNSFVIFCRF